MYGIEIRARVYGQGIDMNAIRAACAAWLAEDQPEGDRISVEFGTIDDAVAAINALGYDTDEDKLEDPPPFWYRIVLRDDIHGLDLTGYEHISFTDEGWEIVDR